ncbi:hypothetical protein B0H16DRAFT_1218508, partial [Mycena metata]
MEMALPRDIPTLKAKGTGNLTRPDNVFCSADLLNHFVSCDVFHTRVIGTTDHYPIVSVLDVEPPVVKVQERWNWREANWEEMNKMLGEELERLGLREAYTSAAEVLQDISKLDESIWRCVKVHVLLTKIAPFSKRWWTSELETARREKEKLSRKSFRKRDMLEDPTHEEFRRARNTFLAKLKMARDRCWLEWLEEIDGSDVWVAGKMMKGAPTD